MSGDWILNLVPPGPPEEPDEPACPPVTLAVASALLGPGPVAWAVRTAREMTDEIIERIPEHGGGTAPYLTLRASVESTVLLALRGLLEEAAPLPGTAVSHEASKAGAEFARRAIPLDLVLRGIRIGHAHLHRALIAAISPLPASERRREDHRVTDLLFTYADAHASLLAEEYLAERARWEAGQTAERHRVIETLLAGGPLDETAASATLGYELARHHQAFVVVAEDRHVTTADLQRHAEDLARALAPDAWLTVTLDPRRLWAWAGHRAEPPADPVQRARGLRPPPGIRIGAGPVAFGRDGLRRSHLGATEAARITTARDWWSDHAETRTLSLATADAEQAQWYCEDVLGRLLADDDRTRELRETLRTYLHCERSPQAAAERLHIARNTVTYRVHRAEELLGHPISDPMELLLALEISHARDSNH
jgi:PucR C-terminal helix-turn-helix domain/GGDEF-like domain